MTETDTVTKSQSPVPSIPEHWSLFLRCTICFGYLRDPHTLGCGHSFCARCLRRQAEIAKEDTPDVRTRHLQLSCPACRHPFPAKQVLRHRPNTSIVLKQLVDLWRRECSLLASTSTLAVRSVCTQTSPNAPEENGDPTALSGSDGDLREEFTVRMRPLDEYCQAVMQRVSESTEDMEQDFQDILPAKGTESGLLTHRAGGSDSDSDSSSFSRDGGRASRSSLSSVSIPDIFGRTFFLPRIGFVSTLPATRHLLLVIWCLYSIIIVGLAQSFLPYVIIVTLILFLVVIR